MLAKPPLARPLVSRIVRSAAPVVLALAMLLAACGSDEPSIAFEGKLGQRVPVTLNNWVPRIEVDLQGSTGLALVDTGAPLSVAYNSAFSDLALAPRARVDAHAFGLRFPDMPLAVRRGGSPSECAEPQHGAIIGQDVIGYFRLSLDYRDKRATLYDDAATDDNGEAIAAERLGGGGVPIDGDIVPVGATRLVVEVVVEGRKLNALVDTGASLSVISKRVIDELAASDRPQLCCSSVALFDSTADARIVRLRELTIGKHTVSNVPALMLPDEALLDQLSLETGRAIDMILGATPLRRFAVDIDMRSPTLRLVPYRDTAYVADEYVLPGFSFCKSRESDGAMRVVDVFDGTDAERRGVFAGTLLTAVEGQSVKDLDADQVLALIRKTPVGQTVNLTFRSRTNGTTSERAIEVERVLPNFE